jgi:uncharacterized protein (TIGR02001 family)
MRKIIGMAMFCCGASVAAAAQDDSGLAFDGYAGIVSDYRERGLSLSDKDPAIVASVGAFADNGFYGGVMGAIIDDGRGGDGKAEFYAGYQFYGGEYTYDLSVELDSIHGDGSSFYPEIKASVARDFGLAYIRGGISYAPDGRWFTPENDSLYISTDLEVPVPTMPELTAIFHVGHDFRSDKVNLWDWGAGVSVFVDKVEVSLMYEDSSLDRSVGKGAVTLGARFYF